MGTITAQVLIDRAQVILQDTTGVRWPDAELLGWLNDGQREVVVYKPNSCVKNTAVKLVAGTKQTLPADGVQLIDVVRNLGSNGATPGRSIRIVMREVLDAQVPDWHSDTPASTIKHYTYAQLDPKTFYVYPPATGTGYVELVYGAVPTDAVLTGPIALDDVYANALIDYVLYRAYSKDSEYTADQQRAAAQKNAFVSTMQGKSLMEAAANPNATAPANPNVSPNTR